ncbi:MAG: flagellar type III secretion system pore protein FliP [Kofleriaceae bacterium]
MTPLLLGLAAAPASPGPVTAAVTSATSQPGAASAVGMVVLLTSVSLLPALVLSCTHFVRYVIVLGFVRTGLGTMSAPPNQVLVGLALFMTLFVSAPLARSIYDAGGRAYLAGELTEGAAFDAASVPLRRFLVSHTAEPDLELFYQVADAPRPATVDEVPLRIAMPAFILGELRTGFQIGLTILLPFLVIDLLAATVLTAMGMVMVPPQVVALPLKLLVFVLIDGWRLIVEALLRGTT